MKYTYKAPLACDRIRGTMPHRVLTPDGGVIMCMTEADALRVVDDMNMLCAFITTTEDTPLAIDAILDAFEAPSPGDLWPFKG